MPTLIGDIGGTQARFALAADGAYGQVVVLRVAEHATPQAAMRVALARLGPATRCVLAIAGPVLAGAARLTNAGWTFDAPALAAEFGFGRQMKLIATSKDFILLFGS